MARLYRQSRSRLWQRRRQAVGQRRNRSFKKRRLMKGFGSLRNYRLSAMGNAVLKAYVLPSTTTNLPVFLRRNRRNASRRAFSEGQSADNARERENCPDGTAIRGDFCLPPRICKPCGVVKRRGKAAKFPGQRQLQAAAAYVHVDSLVCKFVSLSCGLLHRSGSLFLSTSRGFLPGGLRRSKNLPRGRARSASHGEKATVSHKTEALSSGNASRKSSLAAVSTPCSFLEGFLPVKKYCHAA